MIFGKLITAMVTPFKEDGSVDYDEAVKIACHLADNGTDTVLLTGTTGECPTLSHDEEFELYTKVKKGLGSKAKVIAGTGSNCTKTAIASTKKAEEIGVDGALIVVPYYNKPSQEGMYQHFKAVSEAVSIPLMIYNIPGRTSKNMEPETVARLAELDNYIAIKEAAGDLKQFETIVKATPKNFHAYSGDDGLTFDTMKLGGVGVVSVASHLVGKDIKRMINAIDEEKLDEAEEINNKLTELFETMFITTNPVPVKGAMNMLGFKCGKPRLPLVDLTKEEGKIVQEVLKKYGLL